MTTRKPQTILDTARVVSRQLPEPTLTPRWEATLRALYGLPLRPTDMALLLQATRRSEASLRALEGTPARELWVRVGRRGRKSTIAALVAVHEAVFGGHEAHMLPNEQGLIAVVSKDTAGSQVVASFAESHAQALGLRTHWSSIGNIRVLGIDGCSVSIAVLPCNSKAPRGFAVPVVICDEIAHWATDPDDYVNADAIVLTALRAPMAQFSQAKLIAISTPYGVEGEFHETVEASLGDGAEPGMLAVEGPTWEWNPSISEARTHEIERDERRWLQEFKAVPSETLSSAFELVHIEQAFEPYQRAEGRRFIAIDASSLKKDAFSYMVVSETPQGELQVLEIGGWESADFAKTDTLGIVGEISRKAKLWQAEQIFGDQRDSAPIGAEFSRHGLAFKEFPWTNKSKDAAANTLGKLLSEKRVSIVPHARLKRELIGLQAKLLPSGIYSYATNGKDYLAALLTACHAINEGDVRCAVAPGKVTFADLTPDAWDRAEQAMAQLGGSHFIDYGPYR